MVTVNYQTFGQKGFNLRLRIYGGGETKYINVTKLLRGALQKRHWNKKRQMFIPSAPESDLNNETLARFRERYDRAALGWQGSVSGLLASLDEPEREEGLTLPELVEWVVAEKRKRTHEDGTVKGSYEGYEKLGKRLQEYCLYAGLDYSSLQVSDIGAGFVNGVLDWVLVKRRGKGKVYISAMLHALLAVADRNGWFDMERVKGCKWQGKAKSSVNKYRTLTDEQCERFVSMRPCDLPRGPLSQLYHDFCKFILLTGQSPCDAIALKYSDIESYGGVESFVFRRRKISEKQSVPCAIPISDSMREIMRKWKSRSSDGYVFPIRSKKRMSDQKNPNGDIKHFIGRLNVWLKKVGKTLGCKFPLHSYTFRHTAITRYVSKGVPVTFVANMMGTDIKNIERVYYNNRGDMASISKVLETARFS